MLDKAIRELDRERTGLQNQEKKLVVEIKKMAKEGQMDAVKVRQGLPALDATGADAFNTGCSVVDRSWSWIRYQMWQAAGAGADAFLLCPHCLTQVMAKSLVRNRHAVNKMFVLKSNLQVGGLQLATGACNGPGSGPTREADSAGQRPLTPGRVAHAIPCQAVSLRISTLKSTHAMAQAMAVSSFGGLLPGMGCCLECCTSKSVGASRARSLLQPHAGGYQGHGPDEQAYEPASAGQDNARV